MIIVSHSHFFPANSQSKFYTTSKPNRSIVQASLDKISYEQAKLQDLRKLSNTVLQKPVHNEILQIGDQTILSTSEA